MDSKKEKMKTNKLYMLLGLTLLAIAALSACGTQPTQTAPEPAPVSSITTASPAATSTPTPTSISFANDVLPIFENRCIKCHGGEQMKKNLDLKTYASLMTGSENGSVLTPGDAANSLLAQQLINGKMPKKGPKLTPNEMRLVIDWINAGALNN
jgi:hypothetical protein